jgi:hypothetical protein
MGRFLGARASFGFFCGNLNLVSGYVKILRCLKSFTYLQQRYASGVEDFR